MLDVTSYINSNTVYFNENYDIENCTSYSDHRKSKLVENDYVSLEYTSVSPRVILGGRMIRKPLIPNTTPIVLVIRRIFVLNN